MLLQCFTPDQPALTLSELSRLLNLGPSTIHRLLATLEAHNFVEQDEDSAKYRLGLSLFKLGALVQQNMNLRRQAEIALRRLARRTEETAYLCIVEHDEALCLDRVEGNYQVRVLVLDVGGRLPLNCGAAPRTLLAFLPDADIQRLLQSGHLKSMTPYSLLSPAQVWADARQIREQGYVVSVDDVLPGVAAIGAPIRDVSGQVVAALSIAGTRPRFEADRLPELIEAVRQEANAVSIGLGWVETSKELLVNGVG